MKTETELRALVVEDEPMTRRILHKIVRSRGHEVDACSDAETAWTAYQRDYPSLILLDLKLPGMDGIELCRRIRKLPESEETVILFVTAVDQREALEAALEAGADDYLNKPVSEEGIHVRLGIAERRIRDMRERKQREADLRRDALHDSLTGLANLTFIRERISHAARRGARDSGYYYAVLVVDICDFASLNRRHGKESGDLFLKEVAERLEDSVRAVDSVARISADRFAILLDGLNDVSDPTRVANRIHQNLSRPFECESEATNLAACIGIVLSASPRETADEILRDALNALDTAKREGPGSYQMYDPVMHAKAIARVELEARIRAALETDALEVAYQPIVMLETGKVEGFEALLRWRDGDRGPVRPDAFIPAAERSGLIVALGSWVLDRVIRDLDEWRTLALQESPFFVSVNVSGKQFQEAEFPAQVRRRLDRAELPGTVLHLEITETALMQNVEAVGRSLGELKEQSVRVQIDDFGTGYSSLSYLCHLPIDTLKIDRSFIEQMRHSPENLEVVRAIVRLGHNLGMTVLAEGVESTSQLEALRELGCDLGQGFLFCKPVDRTEVPRLCAGPVLT